MTIPEGYTPPHDLDAERGVLQAMLLSPEAAGEAMEIVRAGDFYEPKHVTIYSAMVEMFGRGEVLDPITLIGALGSEAARVGGPVYLHTLLSGPAMATNVAAYAQRVHGLAIKRQLLVAGQRIAQSVLAQPDADADDLVDEASASLLKVSERRSRDDYVRLRDVVPATLDEIEAIAAHDSTMTGVPTGFLDLDDLTNGLHPGQLVVVAGRPAMGKSTLALDFCRAASIRHNMASVIFSLEMGRTEIAMRLLSAESRVMLHHMRSGHMSEEDWNRLATRMAEVSEAPLFIDDSANINLVEIRAKARRLKEREDLRLIVVDYLQLMQGVGSAGTSRQEVVAGFSRGLKLLAKELEVPIVALSQLNRGNEQRGDKRPQLSDLRESGAIEQDSDLVILVHREEVYDPDSARLGEADLIVAKHRNGPIRDVVVAFQGHYSRFVDMAEQF